MSKVKKLSIRGIRNFPVEQEAIIRFDSPLTLITGQNGVGKTTVIECLRYITTGEYPPSSDRGKFFIHDPLMKNQVSVLACVKGQFADRDGKTITIRRTAELTKFNNTVKLKSKDNTVVIYDPATKGSVQLTNRCSETENEAIHALGVSKAILNNVIFCHQDDANWPLDENKIIKDRFDAILDTTSYIKALEALRKIAKSREARRRLLEEQKLRLLDRIVVVEDKERKLEDFQHRLADMTKTVNEMKEKLNPIKDRLLEIKKIEGEMQKMKVEDEKEKVEYKLVQKQCETLSATIKEIFEGTDKELADSISSYDTTLHEKNERISKINKGLQQVSEIEQKLSKILGESKVKIGTLSQQVQDNDKKLQERNQVLNAALKMWNLEPIKDFDCADTVQKNIELIEQKIHQMERSFDTKRMKHDEDENQLEKKVEAAREKRSKINSELKRNEEEMEDLRSRIKTIRTQIQQSNNDDLSTKLTTIEHKISEWEGKMNQLSQLIKNENVEEKINRESKKIKDLEDRLTRLDEEMSVIQSQSALNIKLESLKSSAQSKNIEINKLKEKHQANLKKLLGKDRLPDHDLKGSIDKVQKILSDRLDTLTNEYKKKEYEIMTMEASLQQAKNEIDSKLADNEVNKDKIRIHCKNYEDYDEIVLHQKTKVKSLQNKRGMIAHQGVAYTEYIKELNKNSCCALCERSFSSTTDAKKLSRKLEKGIADYPDLLKQCERELETEQRKYDTMLSMKNIVENILDFERTEKEQLLKNISQKEKEIEEAKKKMSELKELKAEPERKITMIKAMIPDLTIWDHYSDDLMQVEMSLDDLQTEMSFLGRTTDKTMEEIQTEREVLKKELNFARENINKFRSSLDERKEQLRQATEKRTKYLEEQVNLQKWDRDLARMKDELNVLSAKDTKIRDSLLKLRQELVVVEGERDRVVKELDELKSKNRMEQEADRKHRKEFEKQSDLLNALQKEITLFSSKNIHEQLENLKSEVKRHTETCEEKRKERIAKEKELMAIKEDISCHETKKRNLSDNIELRKFQEKLKKLEHSQRQRKNKMGSLNFDEILEEKSQLTKEQQETENQINKASGSKKEIKSCIQTLIEELNEPEAQSARSDYEEACISSILMEKIAQEALAYAKVLDEVTAEYHRTRLVKINLAMNNLWRLIYQGSDIKSIEIRAEATKTTGKTEKRQFNYKLVQTKHGVEMEMRGRCSAGQKVLASIVLRLALAETLSEHTGILALDEPTTNLDSENSKQLAETLYKYTALRARHEKNFQLIVITHDEDFISRLSELSPHHWRQELYRDDNGFSKVRKMELLGDTQVVGGNSSGEESDDENPKDRKPLMKRIHVDDGPSTRSSKKPFAFDTEF